MVIDSLLLPAQVRIGVVDVHYLDSRARAGLAVYPDTTCTTPVSTHATLIDHVASYEPGALYKRELPCIQAILSHTSPLDLLIVDGYATLDPDGRPGLGAHTSHATGLPVIGVAKTNFRTATHAAQIHRGTATKPLYVTIEGNITIEVAGALIQDMAGRYRIPDAITLADHLARGRTQPKP